MESGTENAFVGMDLAAMKQCILLKYPREYFDFHSGRDGWRRFLENYPHDMILIKITAQRPKTFTG